MHKYRLTYILKQPGGYTFTKKFQFEATDDDEAKKEVKKFEYTWRPDQIKIEKLERIIIEPIVEYTTEIKVD